MRRKQCAAAALAGVGAGVGAVERFAAQAAAIGPIAVTVAGAPGITPITDPSFALAPASTGFTHNNGELTYTGPSGRRFIASVHVTATLAAGAATLAIAGVLHNDTPSGSGAAGLDGINEDHELIFGDQLLILATGDRLRIGMATGPGPRDLILSLLSIEVHEA